MTNGTSWIAGKIEHWPIDKLIPYARNARTHSDAQVAQIAASIAEFGFTNPILAGSDGVIIAGHGRVLAARKLGLEDVPVVVLDHLSPTQRRALVIADNRIAENSGWDEELLGVELEELHDLGFDVGMLGFEAPDLSRIMGLDADALDCLPDNEGETDEDAATDVVETPISLHGDVWLLGDHRLMCGDSTRPGDVERLMAGKTAQLLHADPPYGMGKESDGVANDNIYGKELDAFQMKWWETYRRFLDDNASAYIWGNAPDLWRLWYVGGLGDSEKLELRNEIVWDKKSVPGMASQDLTQYPIATERCLFFQLGDQFLGNVNSEDFPDSWEPLRSYMESEAKAAGMTQTDVKRVCGVSMYSHWFTRSQFTLIPEKHYRKLASEFPRHFERPWRELKAEWDRVKSDPTTGIQAMRSYFDNAHEPMRDVWEFPRVTGEERYGHATPKPVAMIERVMKSSLRHGGLAVEPFSGTGTTIIAAEKTGLRCYAMELSPQYVDVAVRRWQKFTGKRAILEATGEPFPEE
jgi:DNA modification methylase